MPEYVERFTLELSAAQRDAAITATDIAHRLLVADAEHRPRNSPDRAILDHHARAVAELMDRLLTATREYREN
jgi:hypothetical protein